MVEAGAVGCADPRTQRPLTPDTPMRVASISKIATALVVMRLVERGAIDLDADCGWPWLRNPAFPDAPITPRQLLSHTSSMRDGAVYWAGLGERIADFFTPGAALWENGAHWSASHPPGAYFTYCNLGFGVLATLSERAAGTRFDLLAHELVLAPLGLAAGFNWSECPPDFIAAAAPIFRLTGSGWRAEVDDPPPVAAGRVFLNPYNRPLTDYVVGENGALFSPQGGLRASVRDLACLARLLLAGGAPLLAPETFAAMGAPAWRDDGANGDSESGVWRAYGLGLQLIEPGASPIAAQRNALIGHSGDAYGFRGGVWADREAQRAFAFVFNGGPEDDVRARGAGFSRAEEIAMATLHDQAFAA